MQWLQRNWSAARRHRARAEWLGRRLGLGLAVLGCAWTTTHAAGWPQFRGPGGTGLADGPMPLHFGPGSNVVWKTPLPSGHSSPVIWADRIFLTGYENGELLTLCLNRANGMVLWRKSVPPDKVERGARLGNPASSTPCTDGTNVFSYFGSSGAVAYDASGRELWRRPLPTPITQHGASSSPVLARGLVILQRDADIDSHLLALRQSDGTIAWRVERRDMHRSFSTPLVMNQPGLTSLIVPGTLRVAAYDPGTGRELWTVRGLPNEMVSSPVAGDGLIFVAGWTPGSGVSQMPQFDSLLELGDKNQDGRLSNAEAPNGPARQHFQYIDANKDGFITRAEWDELASIFSRSQNALLAIRPGGSGDVTGTHLAWQRTRGLPYVPSPLLYQQRLWLVRNGGLISCFKAADGEAFFQEERLGALGDYYASPIAADGKVLVISQQGVATVLASSDELKVLARNNLGASVLATPALVDGTLYLRTAEALYAFRSQGP